MSAGQSDVRGRYAGLTGKAMHDAAGSLGKSSIVGMCKGETRSFSVDLRPLAK